MVPHLSLKVTDIIHETADAITITLVPEDGSKVDYKPGQFITLIFHRNGKEIRRSFSLSSAPGIDADLRITIKRVPNGEISNYIYHHIKPGEIIKALPPAGRFVLEMDPEFQRDIFMVAAGSGITPVFSLIKSIIKSEPKSRVTLVYSNRNERSAIFYAQLNAHEKQYPDQFKCIYIFSDPEDKNYKYKAHLNLQLLKHLIEQNIIYDSAAAEFMLCGPFIFMRMAEMIIIAMGFDESRVHKENFVILAEQEAINTSPVQLPGDKTVTITYHGSNFDLIVPVGKPILKAALDKGIYLPYSCQGGVCGICSAICREGEVQMSVNDVLTTRDLEQGWVLTCVGYPMTGEVRLVIGEKVS
jgi:ferredoxin-NADP reductase